jgi:hypothetical protein
VEKRSPQWDTHRFLAERLSDHGPAHPRIAHTILPDTTHVTLMQKIDLIAPMINDFLDGKPTTK